MRQRQELSDASNGDRGFDDAVDDPRKGVERSRQHREERDGREDFRRRQLVARQRVHRERDDGDQDGRRRPQVNAEGVQILPSFEVTQLFWSMIVDAVGKEIFPGEKFDDSNAGQELGHDFDTLVFGDHHLSAEVADPVGDQLV